MQEVECCRRPKDRAVRTLQSQLHNVDPAPLVCSIGLQNEHCSACREVRTSCSCAAREARNQFLHDTRCLVNHRDLVQIPSSWRAQHRSLPGLKSIAAPQEPFERSREWSHRNSPQGLRPSPDEASPVFAKSGAASLRRPRVAHLISHRMWCKLGLLC